MHDKHRKTCSPLPHAPDRIKATMTIIAISPSRMSFVSSISSVYTHSCQPEPGSHPLADVNITLAHLLLSACAQGIALPIRFTGPHSIPV
eukprot:729602-Pelagomonas_calceolata.AAC.2